VRSSLERLGIVELRPLRISHSDGTTHHVVDARDDRAVFTLQMLLATPVEKAKYEVGCTDGTVVEWSSETIASWLRSCDVTFPTQWQHLLEVAENTPRQVSKSEEPLPAPNTLCLGSEELVELTGKRQRNAQIDSLNTLGIDYRQRADGSLVVFRSSLALESQARSPKQVEPDFSSLAV